VGFNKWAARQITSIYLISKKAKAFSFILFFETRSCCAAQAYLGLKDPSVSDSQTNGTTGTQNIGKILLLQ
jgi:hypothetical protein